MATSQATGQAAAADLERAAGFRPGVGDAARGEVGGRGRSRPSRRRGSASSQPAVVIDKRVHPVSPTPRPRSCPELPWRRQPPSGVLSRLLTSTWTAGRPGHVRTGSRWLWRSDHLTGHRVQAAPGVGCRAAQHPRKGAGSGEVSGALALPTRLLTTPLQDPLIHLRRCSTGQSLGRLGDQPPGDPSRKLSRRPGESVQSSG